MIQIRSLILIKLQRINGGELFERVIDDDFELTEKVCTIFMRQICEGVQYMHEKFIMHLDMKPENILCVTRTGNRIKLIDFGLARRFDPNKTLQVMFGTPDFAAPEVLSYERVTPAADMWSVGVICYVLLSGLSPFMGNSDLETMTNVTKAIYDFDDEAFDPISNEAKDFISKLLVKDPTKRLKPNECLNHKWLGTKTKMGKTTQLSKTKLKKYVVRRRWQKAVTAIMALSRMGANLSLAPPHGAGAELVRRFSGGHHQTGPVKTSSSSTKTTTTKTSSINSKTSTKSATGGAPKTTSSSSTSSTATKNKTSSTTGNRSNVIAPKPPTIVNNRTIISTSKSSGTTSAGLTGSPSSYTSSLSPTSTLGSRFKTSSSSSSVSSTTTSYRLASSTSPQSTTGTTPRRRF